MPVLTTIEVGILKRFGDFHKKPIHQTASSGQARVETFKAFVKRSMRREERVTVQGPVKKQQPDRMSHRGGGGGAGGRYEELIV